VEVGAPWLRDAEVARPAAEIGFGKRQHGIYGESLVHLNAVPGKARLAENLKVQGHAAQPYEKSPFHAA
jgi:hypothetical protein